MPNLTIMLELGGKKTYVVTSFTNAQEGHNTIQGMAKQSETPSGPLAHNSPDWSLEFPKRVLHYLILGFT